MARGESLFRQWRLLKTLQAHRFGSSAEELAQRLECTKRTVLRDIVLLQEAGFPIHFEQRDFGKRFWKLASGFIESDKLVLSVTEMLSLFLSQQLLAPLAGTQFGDGLATAMQKIKALLPERALAYFADLERTILVKTLASHDYSGQDREIRLLNDAIRKEQVVAIAYYSASQGRQIRTLFHPYGMVLFGAALYCIGFLEADGEIRTLKVSRIQGLERTDKTFRRPPGFSLASHTSGAFGVFGPGRPCTVTARFTGWAATNLREQQWHPSQRIVEDQGDGLVAQFELASTVEFKRWILGFGRHATVLRPRELAAEIVAELAAAQALYGPSAS